MEHHDVAVIGGGIVGLATAHALVEIHHQRVIVLEAEDRVAAHQTGHNSGVIHAGLYYPPGSLKAQLCREGRELMYRFCADRGVPHRRCGKLVVAVDQDELGRLEALAERGRLNGLSIERVPAAQLAEYEPKVAGLGGLWVRETGVVDYPAVASALRAEIERRGGVVWLGARVIGLTEGGGSKTVETLRGAVSASRLVNCAGLQSDRVARMAGVDAAVRIVPFRGEYYRLRPSSASLVRGLIYPVPDPALPFLGVHFTRGIDDRVEAGPNAVLAAKREGYRRGDVSLPDLVDWALFPGFWRMGLRHWRTGLAEAARSRSIDRFAKSLQRLVPDVRTADLEPGGAGVRAQAVGRNGALISDFVLLEGPGAVHVLNAPSPAATASLAIGRVVATRLLGT